MAPKFRRALAQKLGQNAPLFGLSEVAFKSFELQHGWKRAAYLSASDVVAALTALLEGSVSEEDDSSVRDRFWRAWQALGERDMNTLRTGLDLAKKLQRAIVQDGGMMIQRKLFANLRHYRIFNLSQADIAHRSLLAQPLALMKLASFLHDAYFQDKKKSKPVIIVGPADANSRCLVVGFSGQPRLSSGQGCKFGIAFDRAATPIDLGSKFGIAFDRAATTINATFRHDRFDANIIEIGVADIKRFINEVAQIARSGAYA